MKKTKIDWCDCTINPVVGCQNGCNYCYAKKINDRFHFIPNWKKPEFFPQKLEQLKSKKPKSIFMDSMSDCGLWTIDQIRKTARAMKENSQHNYIFLTKRPNLFIEKCSAIVKAGEKNRNVWVGTSLNTRFDTTRLAFLPKYARRFVSIEPILADFGQLYEMENGCRYFTSDLFRLPYYPEVIIIGAETGNRKDKVIPKKEWIDNIVNAVNKFNEYYKNTPALAKNGWYDIKIFMKESLRKIMGDDFRQDKLPWDVEV